MTLAIIVFTITVILGVGIWGIFKFEENPYDENDYWH